MARVHSARCVRSGDDAIDRAPDHLRVGQLAPTGVARAAWEHGRRLHQSPGLAAVSLRRLHEQHRSRGLQDRQSDELLRLHARCRCDRHTTPVRPIRIADHGGASALSQPVHSQRGAGHQAGPRRHDGHGGRGEGSRRDHEREPHVRRLHRAADCVSGPAVRHGGHSLRPQQRIRRGFQDGLLPEVLAVLGPLRGGVLPNPRLAQPAPLPHRLRRLGCAAGNDRRGAVLQPHAHGRESGEVPGGGVKALGNPDLKPERSTEMEVGLDGTFWSNRLTIEVTRYDKSSRDALVARILPPSLGTGETERFENLGKVRNWGWEALIDAQLVDLDAFGWNLSLNGTTNNNRLVTLGGLPTIVSSSTLRQREGYPLNGWWSRRLLGHNDANGDGIIAVGEISVSDTAEFHGYSSPRREAALTNTLSFLGRRLRLAAMIDYKGGHLVYNNTERIRCASRFNCAALVDRNASLLEQARTVMVREHASRSVAGFFEKGDFLRFRELALTFSPSDDWAARLFRGRSITATLAARNLGMIWTEFTGVDPEAFGTTGDAPSTFQAFGPPTYYSFRLTLGF